MSLADRVHEILAGNSARIGVAVRHIEGGEEVMIDADHPVPLASVVKVPALVEAYRQIGEGRIRLDDRWTLTTATKTVGSGILRLLDDGLPLTVRDVLTLMITISDNSATDMLFDRIGVRNVERLMHELGLHGIFIKHTIRELFDDMLPSGNPRQDPAALARWEAEHGVKKDGFSYSRGPENNVGTPRDIARLMEMIYLGQVLDRAACDAMLDMLRKQRYNERFPRYLPAGVQVAHKTGSLSGVRNDAGILTAGNDAHVAFALLCTWDDAPVRGKPRETIATINALDDTFGQIGLAVYEAYATQQAGA